MGATSVRLPDDLLRALDEVARRQGTDRSSVMKRAIERGLRQISIDEAVEAYLKGGITAMRAARMAGVTLWEFLDELQRRGLGLRTDEDALRAQVEGLR
jgi:predicted transcriptional regulator